MRRFFRTILAILALISFCPVYSQHQEHSTADDQSSLDLGDSANSIGSGTTDTTAIILPNVPKVNPSQPNIPNVSNNYSVGTSNGNFNVNATGGAEYSLPINCPSGGALTPQISLSYSSQSSSYGLAGYGFSLSGLSSITRGEKNFYNNGSVKGVTYTSSDNLFLDGKRLVLLSGLPCHEGATYCLEGDPYTVITVHGTYNNSTTSTWFEVKTTDGRTYQYGNSADSRISYQNKKGLSRIGSWNVNRIDDVYGNYILYTYSVINCYAYPTSISYGWNSVRSRGLVNRITFDYDTSGHTPYIFTIEDKAGNIDRHLSTITITSNGTLYRKYVLKYNTTSDRGTYKYSRLTQIQEQNGSGESLTPIQFEWDYLPADNVITSAKNIPTEDGSQYVEEQDKNFFAADLNGDGVSDIIRISPVKVIDSFSDDHRETRIYISKSKVSSSGEISHLEPTCYTTVPSFNMGSLSNIMGGSSLLDFDGDGYNDLLLSFHGGTNDGHYDEYFYVLMGSDVVKGSSSNISFGLRLHDCSDAPLLLTLDSDKMGRDNLLCIARGQKDGSYPAYVVKMNPDMTYEATKFSLKFPKKPEKLFSGDFNNDGLPDIIVLYEGGYKIYFNNGGSEDDIKFVESNSKTGTDIADSWRCVQGDFDGDGLIDFVYNISNETCLRTARNNGDGTFTCAKSEDIGVFEHASNKDNNRFAIMVYDINCDGLSDVMVCKAGYVHHGFPSFENEYTDTKVICMLSDGKTLKLSKSITKHRENDANENHIFIGDFDGDGNMELANYGSDLNSTSDTFTENKIHVYKNGVSSQSGKIIAITDGMGNKTEIEYSSLTDPAVYTKTATTLNNYPLNAYTLPLSVVKSVLSSNGVAGTQKIEFAYKDFKIQMTGAGPLGFSELTQTNTTTGECTKTLVTKWDEDRWIPLETKTVSTIGGKSSTSVSTTTIEEANNTFFAYESNSRLTDMDGNTATTVSKYDIEKGVITEQTVKNDGENMYKKAVYSGYEKKSGMWMPTSLVMTQKHADSSSPYSTETRYAYDEKGNVISTTKNYGTPLALTTTASYDVYGNRVSSVSTGSGVSPVTNYNDFDPTGRFVVKSYSSPAAAVNTYTYDKWGNRLTENDITDSSNKLTTSYTYDNWGQLISTKAPDGTETTRKIGWGDSDSKKYYTLTSTSGRPWVLTWFDNAGHEVMQQTFGPQNVSITKNIDYNNKGLVASVRTVNGLLSSTESYTYDNQGRLISERLNSGKETTYTYGNRSVTTVSSGRSFTKTHDSWGNILTSTDPGGNKVSYKYGSNGQPESITTNGSTVTIKYDEAGNRISLTDPDAGTTTYEYAADGKLLKQTDAKKVVTTNTYDELGRIVKTKIGQNIINRTYGTSGNEKLRLTKSSMGNNSVEYKYDKYGRVITEKRNVSGSGAISFSYQYDSHSRLSKTTYPGGLEVNYSYDDYGFRTDVSAAGMPVYKLKEYDGMNVVSQFMDSLKFTLGCDKYGYETRRHLNNNRIAMSEIVRPKWLTTPSISLAMETLDRLDVKYDPLTANLLTRKRHKDDTESFEYDNLDRLISVTNGTDETMSMNYAPSGNILSKSDVGDYTYNGLKPHAVMSVENSSGLIPSETLNTSFNDFNMVQTIEADETGYRMDFTYGPDLQRWNTVLTKNGANVRSTLYAGAYEKITENGVTREFYYIDGYTIIVKENGTFKPYFAFTDNLGSILSVFDKESNKVFGASYDAWGRQEIEVNAIGLQRGYTGHEMLNEFGIINMNGRLYDPVLGRFFSPDNYVQFPDYSQNYNRYSYCLNNPLKFTDPSGENLAFIAFGLFNVIGNMMQAAATGGNIWKAAAISALSSGASYGIGWALGKITNMGMVGKELLRAGAHGISSGVFSIINGGNFGSGFVAGAVSSSIGSITQSLSKNPCVITLSSTTAGGITAWATGGSFLNGAIQGLKIGLFNHSMHDDSMHYDPNEIYTDGDGNYTVFLKEFEFVYEKPDLFSILLADSDKSLDPIGFGFTALENIGESLDKNSQNSTVGNNGKFYFHTSNQRAFYGNQYVKTINLKNVGTNLYKFTSKANLGLASVQLISGGCLDYQEYQQQGSTSCYHFVRAGATLGGSSIGLALGLKYGSAIGVFFGPAAIPAAIIGGTVGGIVGALSGGYWAENAIDRIYGR